MPPPSAPAFIYHTREGTQRIPTRMMQAPQPYPDAPPQYHDIERDAHSLLGDDQQQWMDPPLQRRPLTAPMCLPQVAAKRDATFARGYNEQMMASGISMTDWLRFLDALNHAMAGSPPLRIVTKVAKIAGYSTMGASQAVQLGITLASVAAGGGHAVVQKSLSDRVVQLANEGLFRPRGLVVRICSTEAARALVRTGRELPALEGVDKLAHGAYNAGKRIPILGGLVRKFGPVSERLPDDPHLSLTERRIASLGPYATSMNMGVPPPLCGQDWSARSNAKYNEKQAGKATRKENRADMNRHLLAVARGEAQPIYAGRPELRRSAASSSDSVSSASSSSSDSNDGKWVRKMAKRERKAVRALQKGKVSKFERRVAKAGRREAQHTDDVLWVVLLNDEQDRMIERPVYSPDGR